MSLGFSRDSMDKVASNMSKEVFKAPKAKKQQMKRTEGWSPSRKKKAKNCLLNFCDIVLEYTKYEHMKQEELRTHNTSPLDSGGSTAETESFNSDSMLYNAEEELGRSSMNTSSFMSGSPESGPDQSTDRIHDEDSYESITCFCRKPFAGRPMIECNKCLTWIHLSCAKIRRNNIPDEFTCQRCREARSNKRKSNRVSLGKLTPVAASSPTPVVTAMS